MDEHTEAQIGLRTGHGLPRLADMTKERPFLVSPLGIRRCRRSLESRSSSAGSSRRISIWPRRTVANSLKATRRS
jgi:hypothetical protein